MNKNRGFTIVELLVVIVVIGILAAITIVSFTGISSRAIVSSIQSDLSNASKQIKVFSVTNGSYPTGINCSNPSATELCLQPSGNNIYSDYSSNSSSFYIMSKNGTICYDITDSTQPTLNPVCTPVWIAGVGGMVGKYVYYIDAPGTYTWANRENGCSSGGRSPTLTELQDMYTNRSSYGSFVSNNYWSSETDPDFPGLARMVSFTGSGWSNGFKTDYHYVRCVKG